ncbi:membrane progestin receptor gamma-like isoform X2 [Mya arenaria]|nr:membrane progestin receptor gamma-like isoform X2 [Mya arenaria]XP_052813542.1 membrane progestin receptor gamma-like isoform X2 [Mya arenaria]XP_052813543.1 membrane progestin receptor gamma-like isoform X2 [Mya arenaria]XP_052813544.1 membrane progestin receptor gamma-like isoform X2 [Mya arenaria]
MHNGCYLIPSPSAMFVVGSTGLSGPLFHKDQMPEHFHESFIVKGYRSPKSSPFQCVLSLFDATNETLNFWTHFLPSWYFMWVLRDSSVTLDFRHDSYSWPLLAYMCMCCIYPLASAMAHTFNTMSDNARHICFFLDYSAISASAFGGAIAIRAYCFPSDLRATSFGNWYLTGAFVNSLLCIFIACKTRFMPLSQTRKAMRLTSLGWPFIYATLPLAYRLLCGTQEDSDLSSTYYHLMSIVLMYVSAFLYSAHFPERLFPGSFDIIGHSHQWFHMSVILGTIYQMHAILLDKREREPNLLPGWEFPSAGSSVGRLAIVLAVNTVVVIAYSLKLLCVDAKKLKSA